MLFENIPDLYPLGSDTPSYSDFLNQYGLGPLETGNEIPMSAEYTGERGLSHQTMSNAAAAGADYIWTPEQNPYSRQSDAADRRLPNIYIPDDPAQDLRPAWLSQANATSREAMPGRMVHAEDVANVSWSSDGDHLGHEQFRRTNPGPWAPLSRQNPYAGGTYNPVRTEQGHGTRTHLGSYDQGLDEAWETTPSGRAYAQEATNRFQAEEYNSFLERHNHRIAEATGFATSEVAAHPGPGMARAAVEAREQAEFFEYIRRTNDALREQRNAINNTNLARTNLARMSYPVGFNSQTPGNQGPDRAARHFNTRNPEPNPMMARTREAPRPPTHAAEPRAPRNPGQGYL